MSSNYFYKGINVSQICSVGSTDVPGYTGMPKATPTNYAIEIPLTFGYKSGNPPVDISNQYKAPSTDILSTDQEINIRSYAKACRIISVGGSGGGGGHGGKASSYAYDGDDSENYGGDGGRGGFGSYTYNNYFELSGYNKIIVTVGNAGDGGGIGSNDKTTSNYISLSVPVAYNNTKANAGKGEDGKPGNSSYVVFAGNTSNGRYYQSEQFAVANGGNGGIGGKGAEANATGNSATGNKGAGGAAGNSTSSTSDNDYPVLSNYGIPSGTISVDGSQTGGGYSGTKGAVRIIWLYD